MTRSISLIFLVLFSTVSAQKASFKSSRYLLEMLSDAFETADYKIGLGRSKDLKSAIEKEEGSQSITIGHVHAWKAIMHASLSDFDQYASELDSAKSILEKHPPDTLAVQKAYLTLAKAEAIYGNYQEAILILDNHQPELDSNYALYYDYIYTRELYKFELGYLLEVKENIVQCRVDVESIHDTTMAFKLLRSKILFLDFDVAFELREYGKCSSLYLNHEGWVHATFKYGYGVKAHLFYRYGKVLAHERDYAEANKFFRKSYGSARRYYKLHAPFFIKLQQERINNLLKDAKEPEANYWVNDLDVRVLSYYGKNSVAFLDHKLNEVQLSIEQDDWRNAKSILGNILNKDKRYPADHFGQIKRKKLSYDISLKLGDIKEAQKTIQSLVQLVKEKYSEKAPIYHIYNLEAFKFQFTYTNNIQRLDSAYKESLNNYVGKHLSEHHELYYLYAFGLVDLYRLNEDYARADSTISYLLKEVNTSSKYIKARILTFSSEIKTHRGEYKVSSDQIRKALWILKNDKEKKGKCGYAEAHRKKAFLFKEIGNIKGAKHSYADADRVFSDQLFSVNQTSIKENGWLEILEGRYRKTEKLLKHELISNENKVGAAHYSNVDMLLYLAEIEMELGHFSIAQEYLSTAEKIAVKVLGVNSEMHAKILMDYRYFYESIGNFDKSEESVAKALEILSLNFGLNHIKTAVPKSALALAIGLNHKEFQEKEITLKTKELLEYCENLIVEAKNSVLNDFGDNNPLYAKVVENTGKFQLLSLDLEESTVNITTARNIWVNSLGESNVYTSRLDFLLGEIAYFDSSYTAALEHFTASQKGFQDLFGVRHPSYVEALGISARMYYILGDIKQSIHTSNEVVEKSLAYINTIFPSLSERGKADYWSKIKEHFEFFNTLVFTQAKEYPSLVGKAFDINLQTKAILLNSSLKTKNFIKQSGDTLLVNAYEEWMDKKSLLISAVSMGQVERKGEGIDLIVLEGEIEQLEKYLSQQAVGFNGMKTNGKVHKWQDLGKVLGKEDQVIEIIAFRVFDKGFSDSIWYAVMEVNSSTKGNPSYSLIKEGSELHSSAISYYRNCIKYNFADDLSYGQFWQPIESLITKKGKVYISFDGVYNRLTLETILLPSKEYVIDKYQLIPIGTSRDLLEAKDKEESSLEKTAFLVGNPTFYPSTYDKQLSWIQLEGTEIEVTELSTSLQNENWTTEVLKNEAATEERVKSMHSPTVFHIATHGFYVEVEEDLGNDFNKVITNTAANPLLRSGLLLTNGGELFDDSKPYEFNKADGILTAYEAMNLDLAETDLVVLSACETGLGEVEFGEGVFGLQRSFVVAGAQSIIISLFKVSDEVTTELMLNFYKHWNNNMSKHEAFIAAKKHIMAKYDKVKYWGSFVMIGRD